MSKINFLKKSLKIPFKTLKIGSSQTMLFFEIGEEVFYISSDELAL